MTTAKINARKTIHQGRVFRLTQENVTLENGVTIDLDIVHHPGASAIVPMIDADRVILLRQYRHAIRDFIWEIPAGTLEPDEAPLSCARRELVEETGYSAATFEKLGEIIPVPGYANERIHLFLASGLQPDRQNLDADEVLAVHIMTFSEALNMVLTDQIQDSKTINGLLLAHHKKTADILG